MGFHRPAKIQHQAYSPQLQNPLHALIGLSDWVHSPMAPFLFFLLICISLFMAVGVTVYAFSRGPRTEEAPNTPAATEFERSMMRALARMTRMGE